MDSGASGSLSAAAVDSGVLDEAVYHLTQSDVDALFTLVSNMLSIQLFMFLSLLVVIGILLVVVFVIAVRRV